MHKPPKSKKPPLTERERLKKLNELREALPKLPPKKAVKFVAPTGPRLKKRRLTAPVHSELSDHERWNNLCAALAEDALLDETPPGSLDDVGRIRKRIAHLVESQSRRD